MNQIDQITAPANNFLEAEDELAILALSNQDFSEGVGRLILHMLDKKDRHNNKNNSTSSFTAPSSSSTPAADIYSSIDFE